MIHIIRMILGKENYFKSTNIKLITLRWNFEKFLIDHRGQPVRRYDESLDPSEIVPDIDVLLDNIDSSNGVETETTPRNIDA